MKRWPSFDRGARAFLRDRVRVTASATSGSMRGVTAAPGLTVADSLPCSIQPRSAFESKTILGRYTDATDGLFCRALDSTGKPLAMKQGAVVEEINGRGRRWEVIADAENYADVYLLVPLRPALRTR